MKRPVGGFTLLEVIVVLAIVGLVFGVSGLAFATLRLPPQSAWLGALQRARAQAIETGRPVRAAVPTDTGGSPSHSPLPAPLFLPDGRAIGSGADPLTGAPSAH